MAFEVPSDIDISWIKAHTHYYNPDVTGNVAEHRLFPK